MPHLVTVVFAAQLHSLPVAFEAVRLFAMVGKDCER